MRALQERASLSDVPVRLLYITSFAWAADLSDDPAQAWKMKDDGTPRGQAGSLLKGDACTSTVTCFDGRIQRCQNKTSWIATKLDCVAVALYFQPLRSRPGTTAVKAAVVHQSAMTSSSQAGVSTGVDGSQRDSVDMSGRQRCPATDHRDAKLQLAARGHAVFFWKRQEIKDVGGSDPKILSSIERRMLN